MFLCEECSINSSGQTFSKIAEKQLNLLKNCSLRIYSFIKNVVLCSYLFKNQARNLSICSFFFFFFWGNGQQFKRSILVSLFVVEFRKVLKHFPKHFNSTFNESILHFDELYEYFDHHHFCLSLIFLKSQLAPSVLFPFSFMNFFFFFSVYRFFFSDRFTGIHAITPKENCQLGQGQGLDQRQCQAQDSSKLCRCQ